MTTTTTTLPAQWAPQFGVMYHLTGSGPDVWRRDFDALAAGGFHRLVLWEVDNALDPLVSALDLCAERGLRGCCLPWQPALFANRLAASPEPYEHYKCVGIDGQTLAFYNAMDGGFRREVMRPYLARVVGAIGSHPGLGGYFLDDVLDAESMISYTPLDFDRFRAFVRAKYADRLDAVARAWERTNLNDLSDVTPPRITLPWRAGWRRWWDDWCEARQCWWVEWADDVLAEMPARHGVERVLGDDWYSLRYGRDVAGGFTPDLATRFDAFSFDYTHGVDFLDAGMTNIDRDVAMARDLVAGQRPVTVFLKAASVADRPFPQMRDVIAQSQRCLAAGAAGIDYYIYRAWPQNYAFKNCLANHPAAFAELSAYVRSASRLSG